MANIVSRAASAIGRLFGIGGPKGSGIKSQRAARMRVRLSMEKAAKNTRGGASAGGTSGS